MEDLELVAALAKKKNEVMELVAGILKTGKNQSQGYSYAEEAEVVKVIRKAFIKVGISFSVAADDFVETHDIQTKFSSMKCFKLFLMCTLTDVETGFAEISPWLGAAFDSGDKTLYKAYTSGCKYFLMKTFLLPTGDDVEAFADPLPPNGKNKKPTIKKPHKKEQAVIDAVCAKLTPPDGKVVDVDRVTGILYASKGKYPADMKTVGTIASWFINQNKPEMYKPKPDEEAGMMHIDKVVGQPKPLHYYCNNCDKEFNELTNGNCMYCLSNDIIDQWEKEPK